MPNLKLLFLAAFIVLLSACSHFADGNRISSPSYDNSSLPPLKTPPGMAISFDTLYPIPQRHYPNNVQSVDITPPSMYVSKNTGRGWFSW